MANKATAKDLEDQIAKLKTIAAEGKYNEEMLRWLLNRLQSAAQLVKQIQGHINQNPLIQQSYQNALDKAKSFFSELIQITDKVSHRPDWKQILKGAKSKYAELATKAKELCNQIIELLANNVSLHMNDQQVMKLTQIENQQQQNFNAALQKIQSTEQKLDLLLQQFQAQNNQNSPQWEELKDTLVAEMEELCGRQAGDFQAMVANEIGRAIIMIEESQQQENQKLLEKLLKQGQKQAYLN